MDIPAETDRLIQQVADIQTDLQENLSLMKENLSAALELRAEHRTLQATFRAYIEGDISKEEALAVLDNLQWD